MNCELVGDDKITQGAFHTASLICFEWLTQDPTTKVCMCIQLVGLTYFLELT